MYFFKMLAVEQKRWVGEKVESCESKRKSGEAEEEERNASLVQTKGNFFYSETKKERKFLLSSSSKAIVAAKQRRGGGIPTPAKRSYRALEDECTRPFLYYICTT